jgi:rhomboid protease GluP
MASQPEVLQGNESGQSGAELGRAARRTLGQELQSATGVLIAMNVVMYAVMVARGVSWISPTAESVLKWGADYGPLTLHGQWWRMITSMFLHFGIIHIAFNMFVLLQIGFFMERLAGRLRFVVLYLVCGAGGSAASLAWHPSIVSAGASGAIFGLYGALLGFLLKHRGSIAPEALAAQKKWALTFIGYNLLYGAASGSGYGGAFGRAGDGILGGAVFD